MEMEHEKQDQKLRPDPRTSLDNILTGHQAMNKLEALPNFRTFKNGEEFAITELFHCLHSVHIAATETAGHLAFLGCTPQVDQFSFILKHSMHPLVQLQIRPRLCHPGELKFTKAELTPEEAYEQKGVNTVLPCPHHPKLDGVDAKHPTCCLTAAVHYTLHERLFDKFKESQAGVTDLFLVECKKFFTSITRCTYDTGKKLPKVEKKEKGAKELEL